MDGYGLPTGYKYATDDVGYKLKLKRPSKYVRGWRFTLSRAERRKTKYKMKLLKRRIYVRNR